MSSETVLTEAFVNEIETWLVVWGAKLAPGHSPDTEHLRLHVLATALAHTAIETLHPEEPHA